MWLQVNVTLHCVSRRNSNASGEKHVSLSVSVAKPKRGVVAEKWLIKGIMA